MDREKIEVEVQELQLNLNRLVEEAIKMSPQAQSIVGQITAYRKMLVEGEECSDSEKSSQE